MSVVVLGRNSRPKGLELKDKIHFKGYVYNSERWWSLIASLTVSQTPCPFELSPISISLTEIRLNQNLWPRMAVQDSS